MKKFLLPVVLVTITTGLLAQTDTDTLDLDEIVNEVNVASPDRDRFVFNVHWDGWLGAADSIDVGALSRGVGIHFFYDIPLDAAKQFSFAAGVGWNNSNYYTKALFANDTLGNTQVVPFNESQTVTRSKIVLNYVEVPVEFRFRTKPNTYYSITASPGQVVKNGDEYLQFFSATTRRPDNPCVQRTLGIARTKDHRT